MFAVPRVTFDVGQSGHPGILCGCVWKILLRFLLLKPLFRIVALDLEKLIDRDLETFLLFCFCFFFAPKKKDNKTNEQRNTHKKTKKEAKTKRRKKEAKTKRRKKERKRERKKKGIENQKKRKKQARI